MTAPIPQNLEPLYGALAECGVEADKIPQVVERLTRPPMSLWAWDAATKSDIDAVVPFDGDTAAHMMRLDEGTPDPEATWANLTRSERKRAKRGWNSALRPDELRVTPQGRQPEIDSALVLYLARIICEACRQPRFKFSRPSDGGGPCGPMWRALVAALPLAELFLARINAGLLLAPRGIDEHAETIAEIVNVDRRSKQFAKRCRQFDLGATADDVVAAPAMFRYVVKDARTRRRRPSHP